MKLRKQKGFTLIELMIVVAIIGILAAVAVPKFADLVTKSKEASVKGSLGAVRSAVSIYYGDLEGSYPDNLFTGLTNGNRYMPGVGGQASLGSYDIPKNSQGNTGHSFGNATLASSVVQNGTAGAMTLSDATALTYNNVGGEVALNCTHKDTKASVWTTY